MTNEKFTPGEEVLVGEIHKLTQIIEALQHKLHRLESNQAASYRSTPALEPKVADPDFFNGSKDKVKIFLSQTQLVLQAQPLRYPTGTARVLFAASFLRGDAFLWYQQLSEDPSSQVILHDFERFSSSLMEAFGEADLVAVAERKISLLRQTTSVNSYYTEFKRLATFLKWNDAAQRTVFYAGLKPRIKDELAKSKRAETMAELSEIAVRLDNRIYERNLEKKSEGNDQPRERSNNDASRYDNTVVPMEIDGTYVNSEKTRNGKLTASERQNRIDNHLCLYCGSADHKVASCPNTNSKKHPKVNAQLPKKVRI